MTFASEARKIRAARFFVRIVAFLPKCGLGPAQRERRLTFVCNRFCSPHLSIGAAPITCSHAALRSRHERIRCKATRNSLSSRAGSACPPASPPLRREYSKRRRFRGRLMAQRKRCFVKKQRSIDRYDDAQPISRLLRSLDRRNIRYRQRRTSFASSAFARGGGRHSAFPDIFIALASADDRCEQDGHLRYRGRGYAL